MKKYKVIVKNISDFDRIAPKEELFSMISDAQHYVIKCMTTDKVMGDLFNYNIEEIEGEFNKYDVIEMDTRFIIIQEYDKLAKNLSIDEAIDFCASLMKKDLNEFGKLDFKYHIKPQSSK